jgi:L-lactate dehydrogenase complex protein LldG
VREDQTVGLVPEAFAKLEDTVKDEGRAITLISGPSATSDIEPNRVEGVYGPRTLEVLIIG